AVAVRYFFRREVESDEHLAHGLAFAQMQRLHEDQERGFDGLAHALVEHGDLLDKQLAGLAELRETVLDLRSEIRQQRQQTQDLARDALEALARHQLDRRELAPGDSLSVRDEDEGRRVKQLAARYRELPDDQRRRLPALLNAVGKLEV